MIDCHAHLWDPERGFPWIRPGTPHHRPYTADDLRRSAPGPDITGTVLVEASRGDAGETLALRELRLRRPELVAGYVANLHVHGAGGPEAFRDFLEGLGETRPNGTRLGGASWEATPRDARALVPVLADSGTVLELNLHHRAFDAAARVARAHPGLTVVVDHLGNPPHLHQEPEPQEWLRDLRTAAGVPAVVVKISGLLTQQRGVSPHRTAALVHRVLDAFGPDRCLIGSDWPICLTGGSRAASLAAATGPLHRLTAGERDDVLSANARRVYGLHG
ncbi:amidohydrolase [uncultured Streptomyces sp.]|uniref:amidohydrolase family protein n=1 Tax=uncultured Streptomyces sp. TaxID=174707 RepID=UPI002608CB60|nr:amidohydrolase family protein [uncultured Streptomyces sp.]